MQVFLQAHALLIGTSIYAHSPQLNVPITAADANAVAAVLCDPHYCAYSHEQVTVLAGAAANRDSVLAALDTLVDRVGEGDTVFIFYAGHGGYGDDGYYLTTHDTWMVGRKVAVGTGLREAELIDRLRAIKARRLLLIVNACHSGEMSPVLAPDEDPLTGTPLPSRTSAALLGTGEGRIIISACRENQYAFIGPGPLTLFTQALVDGLQGKGVSSNRGYISVFDLYTHIYFALDEVVPRKVSATVRQRYGEKQEPELTILKGIGTFAVALYRGAMTLGNFDASGDPPDGTAVREVNPAYSQAMLRQHQQYSGDNAQIGTAIAGDVYGNITVDQSSQQSAVHFSNNTQFGDISIGDVADGDINRTEITQGDRITTGDISGKSIAIGQNARSNMHHVDTGGGDYAEGNIDKRRGNFAVAVGSGARATVYIDGQKIKINKDLFVAYYQRLARYCRGMPLQGIYEQRSTTDSLTIDLDRIYTHQATTNLSEREVFEGVSLKQFDAKQYLEQHTRDYLLPYEQRSIIYYFPSNRGTIVPTIAEKSDVGEAHFFSIPSNRPYVLGASFIEDLVGTAKLSDRLIFSGPQLITESISMASRLVLLGEPGSGKSTTLRYLAYTLAGAGLDSQFDLKNHLIGWTLGRLLPIFVPLLPLAKRFAENISRQGGADDLWDYLVDHLQPKGTNAGLAAAVHEEIEDGRAILLLDGLDEVVGSGSRQKVVRAVQSFAVKYPACRIVVTCRVRSYEGDRNAAWQLPGWPTATLADWTLGQMRAFVNAWYHTVAELRSRTADWRDERIAGLWQALTSREDLQRFGHQPLMMMVMALVHLNDGRLPEERARLYGRCIDILLGQWEITGRDVSEYGTLMDYIDLPHADVQSLRPLLGKAAFEAHRAAAPGEVGRLSRPVLRTMVDDELKRRGHLDPSHGADRFLAYTDERAGLIQASDAGDDYSFPHQTFQEYLAGIELVSGVDPLERVLERRNDDHWRRPIMLGVEQLALSSLDLPYRLLSRLFETPGRDAHQRAFDLLLAQEIATDLGWNWLEQRDSLFIGLKRRLAQTMADTLSEVAVPTRDRVQIGVALGSLGDPRPGVCDFHLEMISIEGTNFRMGNSLEEIEQIVNLESNQIWAQHLRQWLSNTLFDQNISVNSFNISRYPITNAQFVLFMDESGYDFNKSWWDEMGRNWLRQSARQMPRFWPDTRLGCSRPNHPVVGVCLHEVRAFCRWLTESRVHNPDGYIYRLPSEVEWELAARGAMRRHYPWGLDDPGSEHANFGAQHRGTTAVGCFVAGSTPEGLMDMAGNVWEWTSSVYAPYISNPDSVHSGDQRSGEQRFSIRGGAWDSLPISLCVFERDKNLAETDGYHLGFRLVRDRG